MRRLYHEDYLRLDIALYMSNTIYGPRFSIAPIATELSPSAYCDRICKQPVPGQTLPLVALTVITSTSAFLLHTGRA